MKLSDFTFELPDELVAQTPSAERTGARLLAHDVGANATRHGVVSDLPELLRAGDLLVFNDTRVVPARLVGRRATGGRVELLLVSWSEGETFRATALVKPAAKLNPDERVELEGGALRGRLLERERDAEGVATARWRVDLERPDGAPATLADVERCGRMPLPPYVRRAREGADERSALDRERYQTVYARNPGAVAAPTAGLHFTRELLAALEARGVERAFVTLHVGLGTFAPVQVDDVESHVMHRETFELPGATARAVARARDRGGRVVAVGTTSVRVLETCAAEGELVAASGSTQLFLRPGSPFRVVDALWTNFHLPHSTLLMLVCAFAGTERTLALYREAVEQRYRFFSYGDAMLLTNPVR